jgi:hypothetical protein
MACRNPSYNKEMLMKISRSFWAAMVVVFCVVAIVATPSWAQPGGGRGGFGGGRGGFGGPGGFGGGDMAGLLRNESVQKELELLDDQIEELQGLAESQRESFRDAFQGLQDLSREERMAKFREVMEKNREEQEKQIGKVLLPHQMKRLKQIQFQQRTRGGIGRVAGNEGLSNELGITEAQREKLQQKAQEVEEEIRAKLNELREQAQAELLSVLTPAQQAKWKELAGEPFEMQFTPPQRGAGGQPGNFGGRGGFGGQRGGGQQGNQGRRPN